MKKNFIIIVLLGCATVRQPEKPTGPSIAILTWNLNYGMPGADEAVDVLREIDAELVCLQETTPEWERLLRSRLAERYPFMQFRHSGGAGGFALLSQTPMEEKAAIPSPSGWFPAGIFLVETRLGPLQIMNVHLHPMVNEAGSFTPSAYFTTKGVRLDEVRAFHSHLAAGIPTVIAGDFNEKDTGAALSWLEERGMTNALREFDPYTKTWHWRTSIMTVTHRLDHVFYSRELHAVEAHVIERGQSDHYPVIARLQIATRDDRKE